MIFASQLIIQNSTILVIMPKFQQIKEIYFQGEGGLHAHLARMRKEYFEYIIKEQLQTIILFRNGSRILAEVPEPVHESNTNRNYVCPFSPPNLNYLKAQIKLTCDQSLADALKAPLSSSGAFLEKRKHPRTL